MIPRIEGNQRYRLFIIFTLYLKTYINTMKKILFILIMMIGINAAAQERLLEYDFYPSVSTDSIPFADSLHTEKFYNIETYVKLVHLYINVERKNHGLNPLSIDTKLMALAQKHSNYMAKSRIYKHSGLNYDEVITHITTIVITSHKDNAGRAVAQWMDSPRHREALLDTDLKTFGIGVQECSSNIIFDGKPHEMINNTYFTVIFDY
jgi:hypothetical protein